MLLVIVVAAVVVAAAGLCSSAGRTGRAGCFASAGLEGTKSQWIVLVLERLLVVAWCFACWCWSSRFPGFCQRWVAAVVAVVAGGTA